MVDVGDGDPCGVSSRDRDPRLRELEERRGVLGVSGSDWRAAQRRQDEADALLCSCPLVEGVRVEGSATGPVCVVHYRCGGV